MTIGEGPVPAFPGAVGFTHLRVYDTPAFDGVIGGSPHVHLASVEAYLVTAGAGEVVTLSAEGEQRFSLRPGEVVWFEPGVIHRLVNMDGNLEILCVMQNAGLPEAGDALLTFPDEVLADPARYQRASAISGTDDGERLRAAMVRRDLAIEGFETLRTRMSSGSTEALTDLFSRAAMLARHLLPSWKQLVKEGPSREVRATSLRLASLSIGDPTMFAGARVARTRPSGDHHGIGMCGRLDGYHPEGTLVQGERRA